MKGCLRFVALVFFVVVIVAMINGRRQDISGERGSPPVVPAPITPAPITPAPAAAPARDPAEIQAELDARLLELDAFKRDPAFASQGYSRADSRFSAWKASVEAITEDPWANPYQVSAAGDLLNLATAYRLNGGRETEQSRLDRTEFWKDVKQAKKLVESGWVDPRLEAQAAQAP